MKVLRLKRRSSSKRLLVVTIVTIIFIAAIVVAISHHAKSQATTSHHRSMTVENVIRNKFKQEATSFTDLQCIDDFCYYEYLESDFIAYIPHMDIHFLPEYVIEVGNKPHSIFNLFDSNSEAVAKHVFMATGMSLPYHEEIFFDYLRPKNHPKHDNPTGMYADGAAGLRGVTMYRKGNPLYIGFDLFDMENSHLLPLQGIPTSEVVYVHEYTHALMYSVLREGPDRTTIESTPLWFMEGVAEVTTGADYRVLTWLGYDHVTNDFPKGHNRTLTAKRMAGLLSRFEDKSLAAHEYYVIGYLATRILHDTLVHTNGTGINEVLFKMYSGFSFDTILASTNIKWHDGQVGEAAFYEYLQKVVPSYVLDAIYNENNYKKLSLIKQETTFTPFDDDTGSLAGSDYGGKPITLQNFMTDIMVNNQRLTSNVAHFSLKPTKYATSMFLTRESWSETSSLNKEVVCSKIKSFIKHRKEGEIYEKITYGLKSSTCLSEK